MPKEGDIGCINFGEFEKSVATMGDEVDRGVLFSCFLQLLFPAGIGLVNLGGTDIESLKVGRFRVFGEEPCQDTCFIAAATSEIEEGKVVFFQEVRPEKIPKIRF